MRLAYEVSLFESDPSVMLITPIQLGFTNASLFTRGHIRFLSLDGISFARPVPIGSILRLRSQILHTQLGGDADEYPIVVVRHLIVVYVIIMLTIQLCST